MNVRRFVVLFIVFVYCRSFRTGNWLFVRVVCPVAAAHLRQLASCYVGA